MDVVIAKSQIAFFVKAEETWCGRYNGCIGRSIVEAKICTLTIYAAGAATLDAGNGDFEVE